MQSIALKISRLRHWFAARSGISKGLLLGFFIPLFLSIVFGLVGAALGNRMEDDPGSVVIAIALMTFDLPGMIIAGNFVGLFPGGDESYAMMFLLLATLPACVFWSLIGGTIGWMIRMTKYDAA
jgi:hypothetical protein